MHADSFVNTTVPMRCPLRAAMVVLLLLGAASADASSYRILGRTTRFYGPPSTQVTLDGFEWSSASSAITSDSLHREGQPFPVPGGYVLDVFASAEGQRARLSASSSYQRELPVAAAGSDGFDRFDAVAQVDLTFDDVIITGPGASVSTSIRLHMDGSVDSSTLLTTSPGSDYASANLSAQVVVDDVTRGDGSFFVDSQDGVPHSGGAGWLASFDGDDVLTTSAFTADTNVPFTVRLSAGLAARAGMDDQKSGQSLATLDFANTFSFAEGEPVFVLPAGYTANSVSAGIVDNVYVGVAEPTAAAPVGLVALLSLHRRRCRRLATRPGRTRPSSVKGFLSAG